MTAAPSSPAGSQGGAAAAFIKGIERRALAVADLQAGDPGKATLAVSAAIRAFAVQSAELPMAQWPRQFWSHLCASPALRQPVLDGRWPPALQALAGIAPAHRLALLLRVGAGLEEAAAVDVLGVEVDAYRNALAAACPRDAAGQPDAEGWRRLADAVQAYLRDLPATRLSTLSAAAAPATQAPRTTTVVPTGWVVPERHDTAPTRRPRPRRAGRPHWQWLLLILGVLVLLAAGWRWYAQRQPALPEATVQQDGTLETGNPVLTEALDDAPPPPSPGNDMHAAADAAMLSDPQLALARDADLLAWLAAGGPMPVDESEMQPSTPPAAGEPLETAEDGNE